MFDRFKFLYVGVSSIVIFLIFQYYSGKVSRLEEELATSHSINMENLVTIDRLTRLNAEAVNVEKRIKKTEVKREEEVRKAKKQSAVIDPDWGLTKLPPGVIERLRSFRSSKDKAGITGNTVGASGN